MSGMQKQNHNKQTQSTEKRNKPKAQSGHQVNPDQLRESPESLNHADVLAAQKQLGNQVVQRALNKPGKPEASVNQQGVLDEKISKEIQQKRGSGGSLPADFRKESETMLGADFSDVRVHTDDKSDKLSRAINARAFTIGKDIFFKRGVFSPKSSRGRETLIHELTHVVQQSGSTSTSGKLKLGKPDTAQEKEAAKIGKQGAAKQSGMGSMALPQVQREHIEDEELLQGEPDTLQREPIPEEEEMVQGEPDTVQRELSEEDLEVIKKSPSVAQRKDKLLKGKQKSETSGGGAPDQTSAAVSTAGSSSAAVEKDAKDQGGSAKQDEAPEDAMSAKPMKWDKEQQRIKLMGDISDKNASQADVEKATEELNAMHKRGRFKKGWASKALKQRKASLKEAAERGEEGAFEKYKEHKAANPSKKKRIEKFMKKGGGMALKGMGKVAGGGLNMLKEHYLGKSEESEAAPAPAAAPTAAPATLQLGGGMAEMMDKYAELKMRNEELEKQVELLKKSSGN